MFCLKLYFSHLTVLAFFYGMTALVGLFLWHDSPLYFQGFVIILRHGLSSSLVPFKLTGN